MQGAAAAGVLRCEREGEGGTRETEEEARLETPNFEVGTGKRQGRRAVSTRIEKEVGESGGGRRDECDLGGETRNEGTREGVYGCWDRVDGA